MTDPYMTERLVQRDATILINETTSSAVDCIGVVPVALIVPVALTGTQLTATASFDGSTYFDLYIDTSQWVQVLTGTTGYVAFDMSKMMGIRRIKFVSDSAEAAARALNLICRGI